MISSRPYLVSALFDWIVDSDMTPYILVDATNKDSIVPQQYVEDGKIVLNLSPQATESLSIEKEFVMFSARFAGKAMEVSFPMDAVMAIYAKENGQGMVFQEHDDSNPTDPDPNKKSISDTGKGESSKTEKVTRPSLKIVK